MRMQRYCDWCHESFHLSQELDDSILAIDMGFFYFCCDSHMEKFIAEVHGRKAESAEIQAQLHLPLP